ncbi:kell blood group glycoprotein isoform X2 [Dunckerocampus dactyliophorus]|uniref:kell blood group glycoprotein isoform X2 n=1 Tax=Dunckerocampus dactyliophorus TaxID=161453 RepID=UPI0024063E6F|nr:kell blood group glycoprotein isoform X2 [Dunckerocampus dactyliophorus]
MSETPKGLELHLPTQEPAEANHQQQQQQTELGLQPLPGTNVEQQQADERTKTAWIKYQCPLSLFILGFCSCAAILGMTYYLHHFLHKNQAAVVTPCSSPACQRASAHLSMAADPFTHPCDYFMFSCGPDSEGHHRGQNMQGHQRAKSRGRQSKTREDRHVKEKSTLDRKTELFQYIREILESNDSLTSSAVQKAKSFYRSCLDTRSLDTAGVEPFLTLIQKLGGWPVSGQWNQTDFNVTLSVLMRDYATFPFFNLYVGKDPNDNASMMTKRYIEIDQPDLLIPIEWNSKTQKSQARTETLRPFLASCQRYLALLGAPASNNMIHVGMFISLSSELAVAATPLSHRMAKGQLYQRMTIKELQHKAPAVDWLGCLQAAFHPQPLMEDDHVLLHNLPYIVQMSRTIAKWLTRHELSNSGPLHTFMVLNLLHTLMPALDSRISDTANNLSETLGHTGVRQHNLHFQNTFTVDGGALHQAAPRWKRCVLETERGFHRVLAYLFRENISGGEAEEMIYDILSSLKSQVHQLKWTDDETLEFVMKKVKSITPRLVTTKEISNEAELDLLFSQVSVRVQSFFSNYLQLLSLWQKRRSKLLNEQNDGTDILSVSPSLLGNDLIIPMGMFIPPLFHPTYPRAMNYGVVGFLFAKDVLHLLLPEIYSQSESVRAVGECVWSHYLTVTGKEKSALPLPAAQQQEVWLQYSALQIALKAYKESLTKQPADTSVSGFSLTRLFFMSFSQVNCHTDPDHHLMPLEPSFLISAICAKSRLCPTNLECPKTTQRYLALGC